MEISKINEKDELSSANVEEYSLKMTDEHDYNFINMDTAEISDQFPQLHWLGAKMKIVGLLFCSITLAVILINGPLNSENDPPFISDDVKRNSSGNDLFCNKMDTFALSEDIFVNTCILNSELFVLLRNDPLRNEIALNQRQWFYLKASISHIDKSIFDWKNVAKL